jgi:NitT/TauT family transport system permease protein
VRWYRRNERVVLSIAGVVAFFILWQIGADAGVVDKFFFSAPTDIAAAAWTEVQNPRFWEDMKISGWELFVGSAIALVVSIPLGLLVGWYRRLNYAVDPWLNFANALPRVALIPLVVLTSRRDLMGALVNRKLTTLAAALVAALIICLNVFLLAQTFGLF